MAGYVLADVEWFDEQGRARYVELLGSSLDRYGGALVAGTRDGRVQEGDWEHEGILVLIRVPSLESAVEWYESPEYQPALEVRETCSRTCLMILEGD